MVKDRRLGRFYLKRDFVNDYPDAVRAILQGVIVLRVDMCFASDCFRYEGISDRFEKADAAFESPFYKLDVDEIGEVTCEKIGFEPDWKVDHRCLAGFVHRFCSARPPPPERAVAKAPDEG